MQFMNTNGPLSLERPAHYKSRTKQSPKLIAVRVDVAVQADTLIQNMLLSALAMRGHADADMPSDRPDPLGFFNSIRDYADQGQTTEAFIKDDIPYFMNNFGLSITMCSDPLQGVPYRASFNAKLAKFLIEMLSLAGDVVFDPFLGSGTTAIQAARMGRQAYGSDINPLAVLLTRPRLDPDITQKAIGDALATIDWSKGDIGRDDLGPYFHTATAQQMGALRDYIHDRAPLEALEPDPTADWIRMAALARLTGHSCGYLSGRSLPPNQMTTIAGQQRLNEKHGLIPTERDVAKIIAAKSRSLLRGGCVPPGGAHKLGVGPAWDTPWIRDASVDLVVTSPPFINVVDYAAENWMKMWFAGIDPEKIAFSHFASLEQWSAMIRKTLVELLRVVKPGGYIALEVGEVKHGTILLEQHVWAAAHGLPCRRLGVIVHNGKFTKSSNIFGVTNGKRGTNTNRIVILQRV
jgi:methylase of polypeptide subunit release factors